LHAATRPLGWTARYLEQEYPGLFDFKLPTRGVLPLVELGGPVGFLGGLFLYDNHLFGSDHSARIEGLYGGTDTFDAKGSYQIPTPLGPGSNFKTVVNVFSDPKSEFYLDGNDNDVTADETRFSRDQVDVTAGLSAALPDRTLHGKVDLIYEHVEVRSDEGLRGQRLTNANPAGLGTADLLTSRLALGLDYTDEPPRLSRGTEIILQLDYTHDLTTDHFRYGRYVVGGRQYLPVGFFPDSRRLALRGRLEQVEPLFGGAAVPFYQLPALGGQNTLRGFQGRRFQNDGSLVLNAEYRYPLWSNLDALIFVDAGQVFDTLAEVGADRFHWSYGGGGTFTTR
jgi:outer membrane protein assembly factor BamA